VPLALCPCSLDGDGLSPPLDSPFAPAEDGTRAGINASSAAPPQKSSGERMIPGISAPVPLSPPLSPPGWLGRGATLGVMETRWPGAGQGGSPRVGGPVAGQAIGGMEGPMAPVGGGARRRGREMARRGAGVYTDGTKRLVCSANLGGVARRAVAAAKGIVTMGWTEAAVGSSGMVGSSRRRSVTLVV